MSKIVKAKMLSFSMAALFHEKKYNTSTWDSMESRFDTKCIILVKCIELAHQQVNEL